MSQWFQIRILHIHESWLFMASLLPFVLPSPGFSGGWLYLAFCCHMHCSILIISPKFNQTCHITPMPNMQEFGDGRKRLKKWKLSLQNLCHNFCQHDSESTGLVWCNFFNLLTPAPYQYFYFYLIVLFDLWIFIIIFTLYISYIILGWWQPYVTLSVQMFLYYRHYFIVQPQSGLS